MEFLGTWKRASQGQKNVAFTKTAPERREQEWHLPGLRGVLRLMLTSHSVPGP